MAMLGPRLRNVVLIAFALFVAHDAIYVAKFGIGDRFARAMSAGGHDGYWAPVSLGIGIAAAVIFTAALGMLTRLNRVAAPSGSKREPAYLNELASTWLRLFPAVGLLFAAQENIEHFMVDGHLAGLSVVLGPDILPILAMVTFAIAATGSLLRWRIRVLEARIAAAEGRAHVRLVASVQPREWAAIAAAAPHRWMHDRLDAGRAPPRILPPRIVAPV